MSGTHTEAVLNKLTKPEFTTTSENGSYSGLTNY